MIRLIGKTREIGFECSASFELKGYVWRFAAKLRSCGLDERYVDAVAAYAAQLCDAMKGSGEIAGKSPACVAAAAMRVADELMGGWIGRERMKRVLDAGFSKQAYRLMREKAPPIPASLWEKTVASFEKRVVEVKGNEVVGNAAR